MKELILTQGKIALVDDEDFDYLSQFKWTAFKYKEDKFYAGRSIIKNGERYNLLMHREIMATPDNMEVDHKDYDGLNNQKYNLRNCSHSQNNMNRSLRSTNTSGYKGVCWDYLRNRWSARITINYKCRFIGYFVSKEDAACAYNEAAIKYHGDFAKLNEVK